MTASTSGGSKLVRVVGESESSHFSQGHYRIYFGLGSETVRAIEVRWPDGVEEDQGIQGTGGNRVFTITRRSPLQH